MENTPQRGAVGDSWSCATPDHLLWLQSVREHVVLLLFPLQTDSSGSSFLRHNNPHSARIVCCFYSEFVQ